MRDVPGHPRLDVVDDAPQVATGHVALHHDACAATFSRMTKLGPRSCWMLGERRQRHLSAVRASGWRVPRSDRRSLVESWRRTGRRASNATCPSRTCDRPCARRAVSQGLGDRAGCEPVAGDGWRGRPHLQRRNVRPAAPSRGPPRRAPRPSRPHRSPPAAQLLQIVAEDLDGDVGARARQHVVDAVRDRLADRDVRAREQRHLLPQLLEEGLLRTDRSSVRPHVDLGRLHALHVLVEFRSSRAPGRRRHLRVREHQPLDARCPGRRSRRGACPAW